MKKTYPKYAQGELDKIIKKLSKEDKLVLEEFTKKCSITAGENKVAKIRKFIVQLSDITQTPLTKQTKETIDHYLLTLSKSDRSKWTKDELKIYIKQFILWLYKDLNLIENFKAESRRELNPQKVTENNLVTEEDIEKMIRFCESYKEKAYILLAFQTGARPQELYELKWKDILFEDKYADITLYSKKTQKSRTFPVVDKTKDALWEWKQHYSFPEVNKNDYVFPSYTRDKPITSAGLNKMLRRVAEKSGLNKDVWGYLLRHTRATKLYEELPQQIVEKLMGHKNMAGIYAHISSKKAREMMLNKIYKIEEVTKEDNEQIQKLQKEFDDYKKQTDERIKRIKIGIPNEIMLKLEKTNKELFEGYIQSLKSNQEFIKNIKPIKLTPKQKEEIDNYMFTQNARNGTTIKNPLHSK